MKRSAAKLSVADLGQLGKRAAEEAVLRDLEKGVTVEGGVRGESEAERTILLGRLSPDRVLQMVRRAKAGAAG